MDEKFVRDRITALRMQAGISEREMSLALGHSSSYINGISSGRISPSLKEFLFICEYLEVSPSVFFLNTDEISSEIKNMLTAFVSLSSEISELAKDLESSFKKYSRLIL